MYLIIILLFGFVQPDAIDHKCEGQELMVTGNLSLVGHEPFVRTALITPEDERYIIKAEEEVIDAMWQSRSKISVTGCGFEDLWYAQKSLYLEVITWESENKN